MNSKTHNKYQPFALKPMHAFLLEFPESWKCLFRRLACKGLVLNCPEKSKRSTKSNKTATLQACNEMSKRIQNKFNVPGIFAGFSSYDISNDLNGSFTSEGICCMLKAKIHILVDLVFPFIATLIERVGGDRDSMPSFISILYIEIVTWVMERPSKLPWTQKQVSQLENVTHNFRGCIASHFGKYQPSGFCTESFHAMCHLRDEIRLCGSITMLEVGLYDNRPFML